VTRTAFSTSLCFHDFQEHSLKDIGSTDPTAAVAQAGPTISSAITQVGPGGVRLLPNQPPGRSTRKALTFADEIRRLYATGYTLEAIRRALAAVGVSVSRSTVHREVTRPTRHLPAIMSTDNTRGPSEQASPTGMGEATVRLKRSEATVSVESSSSPDKPGQSSFANGPRGKDVAEAFMATQITNPFMRNKEQR
jgi:hypothetical protein